MAVLELLAGKNQSLILCRNPLLILDFRFDIVNRIAWLHFKRDGFSGQSLHKDLHGKGLLWKHHQSQHKRRKDSQKPFRFHNVLLSLQSFTTKFNIAAKY